MKPRQPIAARAIVLRAASTTWIYRFVHAACGLIVLPITVAHLTRVEFGVWVVTAQALSFLTIADFGSTSAIGRLLARERGLRDTAAVDRLLSTTFAVAAAASLSTVGLVAWLATALPRWLGLDGSVASEASLVVWISGVSLACQFLLRPAFGILTGYQLYGAHEVAKALESVFTLVAVAGLAWFGELHLGALAFGRAAASLVAQSIQMIIALRLTGPWHLSPKLVSRASLRSLTGLGTSILFVSLGLLAQNQGLGLLVGFAVGPAEAGLFGAALAIMNNLQPLITSFTAPLSTLASEWNAAEELDSLRRTTLTVVRFTAALAAIALAGASIFAEMGVQLLLAPSSWTAAEISSVSRSVIVMCIGVFVSAPVVALRLSLQGTGHHWLVARALAAAVAIGGLIAAVAVAWGAGLVGAAAAWTLVWMIQGVVFSRAAARHGQSPGLFELARAVYPAAIAVGVTTYGLTRGLLVLTGPPTDVIPLLLAIALSGVLGLAALVVILRPRFRRKSDARD